ncbi:GtrA family protein [Pseudomonas hormoni]|uniref:GtrA family protein n=1 Tax=Pseudomonas hormoni TaxID=3093767 RepID=UPI002028E2B2|nr:GtrA family protein [Pseudomonas hormoni]
MQLIKYGAIGVASNVLGYLIYLFVTYCGIPPLLAMTLLYSVGAIVGFVGNRHLTFSYSGSPLASGFRYVLVHMVGYFLNLTLLLVFVEHLGYPHQIVQAVAIFIVAAFLFVAFKFFVFRSYPE